MTRFAIHLETGVVVAITPETKNNYLYQEIEPEVAKAIQEKRVSAQWVIDQIVSKMPRQTLREKVKLEGSLNVRSIDFGLREAARAAVDLGEENAVHIDLPPAAGEGAAPSAPSGEGAAPSAPAPDPAPAPAPASPEAAAPSAAPAAPAASAAPAAPDDDLPPVNI